MLNNIFRVIQITRLFIKYDVDKMLVSCGSGKCKFYFYMLPWNWFRKRRVDNIPLKIKMMLEELGPIFVKLGQVISTRKDLLEYCKLDTYAMVKIIEKLKKSK